MLANQTMSGNKEKLDDLKSKLEAIVSIVQRYQKYNGSHALDLRIENFCQFVTFSCFKV
jgi:hypothetical protein